MTRDESLQVIRNFFTHVDVLDIVVEFDELLGEDIAKVVVTDEQLGDALREDGYHPRNAAIQSGISVEVVLENEINRPA